MCTYEAVDTNSVTSDLCCVRRQRGNWSAHKISVTKIPDSLSEKQWRSWRPKSRRQLPSRRWSSILGVMRRLASTELNCVSGRQSSKDGRLDEKWTYERCALLEYVASIKCMQRTQACHSSFRFEPIVCQWSWQRMRCPRWGRGRLARTMPSIIAYLRRQWSQKTRLPADKLSEIGSGKPIA